MRLTPDDVQDIVSLLDSLQYDEFDVRTSELRVSLRRTGGQGWTQESRVLTEPDIAGPGAVSEETTPPAAPAPQPAADDTAIPEGLHAIRAPLPGTFYRAPKPGADPYVEIGDRVTDDTVVGLLETMKLFNSVHAEVRGEVVEFRVGNGQAAAKDAVLVLIRPEE